MYVMIDTDYLLLKINHICRVTTTQPEWSDPDINVRYKPTEWMSKDEFALPAVMSLCLLSPIQDEDESLGDEI